MPRTKIRIDHRVPITAPQMFATPYSEIPVDRDDPRGREPLVSLESAGIAFESYYAKTGGNNPPFGHSVEGSSQNVWLRQSVTEKLARVNQRLRPFEAELFVLDGYRSVDCQKGLWNFYHAKANQMNQNASEDEQRAWV